MNSLSLSRARRVSISQNNDQTIIKIQRRKEVRSFWVLVVFTAAFVFVQAQLVPAFFKLNSVREFLYLLPIPLFVCLWYFLPLWMGIWMAFGVEEIVIEAGVMHWEEKALWFKRAREIPLNDITTLVVKIPWHEGSGKIRFRCKGRTFTIGDNLLPAEANEIADVLRHFLPASH